MTLEDAGVVGPRELAKQADDPTNEKAARLVEQGKARWEWDGYVAGVLGLMETSGKRRALVVVNLTSDVPGQGDFETCNDFEEMP